MQRRGVYEINVSMYKLTTDRPTDDRPLIWKNLNGHISAIDLPIHFMFGSRGTADRIVLFPVRSSKIAVGCHNGKFQIMICPPWVIWSMSCFILGWGLRSRRIVWFYFLLN